MPRVADDLSNLALAQQIQQLYETHLGHHPSKIICQSFEGKLAILLEDALTQPETGRVSFVVVLAPQTDLASAESSSPREMERQIDQDNAVP